MTTNLKQVSGSLRLRGMLCVFLFIAAGIAVICATGIGEREHLLAKVSGCCQPLQQNRAVGD